MANLLPEAWLLEETAMEAQLRRQKGPVTDILLWVQCFAMFAGALATTFPDKVPELMAYMTTIVRCHRDYKGPAWVLYDRAFRRRAEATKDMNWSVMNTSLFNICFGMICQVCLSESHTTERCPRRVVPLGNTLTYSAAIQSDSWLPHGAVWPHPSHSSAYHGVSHQQAPIEICRLFNARNGNRCRFPQCRFAHICSRCKLGGHGASQCSNRPNEIVPPPKRAYLG